MSDCFNRLHATLLLSMGIFALGACSPRDLETQPLEVSTAEGIVVCQLYTTDLVYWDRSVGRPEGMSSQEADAVCVDAGRQRARDSQES
jgi:hypothetical protein